MAFKSPWPLPSWLSGAFQGTPVPEKAPDKYVLVPPLFERANLDRDRFLHSSYEYAFAKRQLQRLMQDYQDARYQGILLLSPPVERRLSVEARIAPSDASMTLRFQPQEFEPSTFFNVTVTPQAVEKASLGCSLFDPRLGVGVFATAPLARKLSGTTSKLGVRYSSPFFSTGLAVEPAQSALSSFWAVGRYAGAVGGLQLRLDGLTGRSATTPGALDLDALRSRLCYAVAYEPTFAHPRGSGQFTASLEMREGRNLIVSFFQHMAQIRKHVNPLEDKHVVGITNYIDLGIQINLDLTTPPPAAAKADGAPVGRAVGILKEENTGTINAAAAWQVNKNWLLKCRIGDQSAGAGIAVKTWGQTGLVAAANITCRYDDPRNPRYGATLQLENFGERRYERGVSVASGRAVLQRHEANQQDVANAEGTGKVVIREALESEYNPPVTDNTANYL